MVTSPNDGGTWNLVTGFSASVPPKALAWSPSQGRFVAVGSGQGVVAVSVDGFNWTTEPVPSSVNLNDIAHRP